MLYVLEGNFWEEYYLLIWTVDDKIRDEKLQYDINRETVKISALSLGKSDKYECITGEQILICDQSRIIEQAKFTYFSLGKAFKKQIKTTGNQRRKQVEALKLLKPEEKQQDLIAIEEIFQKK